jgi:hypothetical protein
MYIRTSGKPSKIPLKDCKEAVKFYGRKLMRENLYHKVSLEIVFEQLKTKEHGERKDERFADGTLKLPISS